MSPNGEIELKHAYDTRKYHFNVSLNMTDDLDVRLCHSQLTLGFILKFLGHDQTIEYNYSDQYTNICSISHTQWYK
jgi:hypothetical protein